MSKSYRPYDPDQQMLLPTALREWLPDDHLAYFISDALDKQTTPLCCIARIQALLTLRYSSSRYVHHTFYGVGFSPTKGGRRFSLQPPSSGD